MQKTDPSRRKTTNYNNLERLTFLVDGIFAITITLLVLDLRPPESDNTDFLQTLRAMLPRLLIYFIAFYSIASYWVIHQHMFRHITGVDETLTWLMIVQMLFITLIPVSTAIVGRFPQQGPALAFFSINSLLHATANWLFCAYAARHQKQFAARTDARVLEITSQIWLHGQCQLSDIDPARLLERLHHLRILDPSACHCFILGNRENPPLDERKERG